MTRSILTIFFAVTLLWVAQPVVAQQCGDVNGDDQVNISDLVWDINYIAFNGDPDQFDLEYGDCDGRAGVTVSDVMVYCRYFFWLEGEFDCSASGVYGFAPSEYDTVQVPRMLGIPEYVDTVVLPVVTVFDANTNAFYLPTVALGAGSNEVFEFVRTQEGDEHENINSGSDLGDTTVLVGAAFAELQYSGRHNHLSLVYGRVSTGIGNIVPEVVDRNTLWQYAVEKDRDLYKPVLEYYDVELPADTLHVDEISFSFTAIAGYPAEEHLTVEFISSGAPIAFNLEATESWIDIEDLPPDGLITPATVYVTATALGLSSGIYNGQIDIIDIDPPSPALIEFMSVSLEVTSPSEFPPGDLDCTGQVDGADLSMLIDALFINPGPIAPCE